MDSAERVTSFEESTAKRQRRIRGFLELLGWVVIAAPGAVFLVAYPRPDSLVYRELFNVSHVVISGFIALVVLRLSSRLVADVLPTRTAHYLASAVVTVCIGGGLEIVQLVGPGDAAVLDLVRDGCGAVAALCFARSADRQFTSTTIRNRWLMRGGAGLALLAGLMPTVESLAPLVQRRASFPLLAGFDTQWDDRLVSADDGARVSICRPPPEFTRARGPGVAEVRFSSGEYPRLELIGLGGAWSTYDSLVFDVYSPDVAPVIVELRVHDRRHRNEYEDRFNRRLQIDPGESTITIPVVEIRDAPQTRHLDLDQVEALVLFMTAPEKPITLFFDSFRLE